jgi:hypothetical protein
MTKKASQANTDEPKANETPPPPDAKADAKDAAPEDSQVPATTGGPGEQNKYLQLFLAAQQECIDQLTALVKTAEDDDQMGLQRLMKSAKPVVKGREEMAAQWNIPTIRVVYGTTKDPAKPASAKVGEMYATNGRMIKAPFKFTPLYIFESNRNFQEGQNVPICWSPDAKLGTMFGRCLQCSHLPMGKNPTGEKTDCNNGVCMIVMSEDWKIYRLEFFKTSRKAGASVDRLIQSQDFLWERWFELKTSEVSSGGYDYYVFKTAPQGDDVPAVQAQACDILYSMIKIERDAFLEKHYEQTLSADGDSKATSVDEDVDSAAMGISPDTDTNPSDIADGGL